MNSQKFNTNRIQEMDALRGIALFGILLVNVFVFHAPIAYYGAFYGAFEGIQLTTVDAIVNFAGGKFLFIFAFLFGYGIVLLAKSHAEKFKPYFLKRMLVLFIFGVLHLLLFWFGDILASYAVLGLLVMPLLKLSNRGILILGLLFIFFRPLYFFGVVSFDWSMAHMGELIEMDNFITVFQEGSYFEIFKLRMAEFFAFIPENLVWYIPKSFGLFLIGIYAARKTLFARIKANNIRYLIVATALILCSVIWIYCKSDFFSSFDLEAEPIWRPILIAINISFETALGIAYIIGFSLLFQKSRWLSNILAKTGRLALTNYIAQSLICVLIFYGYGLGYYGKLRPTDLVLITIAIFSLNILFSYFYLKFYRFGPLEYVWRKLIRKGKGSS